jgi:hypothetical protein
MMKLHKVLTVAMLAYFVLAAWNEYQAIRARHA